MKAFDTHGSRLAIVTAFFGIWLAVPSAWAAEPVGITAIDVRSRIATADPINSRTSRVRAIQFRITDAALLRTLKVGQVVYADLATMKVSLDPQRAEPCCTIVKVQAATPGNDSQIQATGQAMQTSDEFGRGGLPPRKVTVSAPPNCSTCAGDCKKCTDAGQDCQCSFVSSGSSPGPEDDVYSCMCSSPEPRPVGRNR